MQEIEVVRFIEHKHFGVCVFVLCIVSCILSHFVLSLSCFYTILPNTATGRTVVNKFHITLTYYYIFSLAIQPSAGYGLLWLCSPARAMASSFTRFLDHTQRRATFVRNPLDERSAHRRDLYLTTHNTHNRQSSMPPVGFESTIAIDERP
jgi:hypothetical protein